MTYDFRRRGRVTVLSALLLFVALGTSCQKEAVVGLSRDGAREPPNDGEPQDAAPGSPETGPIAPVAPVVIDECIPVNPAQLDRQTTERLLNGGEDAVALNLLYPYDGTVFPGSGPAPLVMWSGPRAEFVHVRLRSKRFDYRICAIPTGDNRLQLSQAIWDAASVASGGGADPFELTLTTLTGGVASGPAMERVVVARAPLPGSVYYMTVAPYALGTGRIVRVTSRGEVQTPFPTVGCGGCHTASADGTRFILNSSGLVNSVAFSATPPATLLVPDTPGGEFSGIYPDGTLYVASAHRVSPPALRNYGRGAPNASLHETSTGALVPDSGIPPGATSPAFSPDGKLLTFNDVDVGGGHELTLMDFSPTARRAGSRRTIFWDAEAFPGWPTFVPGGRAVIFALGAASDFSGGGLGNTGKLPPGPRSDLFVVDVATGTATMLHRAMGFASAEAAASERPSPPLTPPELHQAYYPMVSPAVADGYAWVFFDTYRNYGNLGPRRAIWGAALTLAGNGQYVSDPSHPPFFLSGQDLFTPNFRAIHALDPCLPGDPGCNQGAD